MIKLKSGIMLKKVMGNYMIISTQSSASYLNSMQTTNETGAFLWKFLEKGTSEDEMLKALLEEFDVSEEAAREDIRGFIKKISDAGLIEQQ